MTPFFGRLGGRFEKGHPAPGRETMPRKAKHKEEANLERVVDSFESWLEKQKPKPVRAKSGFIADAKIEEST